MYYLYSEKLTKFFPSLDPGPSPQDYYHTTAKAPGGLLLEMIGCKLESLSALSLEIVDYKYQLDVISSSDECKGESIDVSPIRSPKHALVNNFEISPTKGYHSNIKLNITKLRDQNTFLLASFSESFFADPFELDRLDFEIANVTTYGNVDLEVASNSYAAQGHFVLAEFTERYVSQPKFSGYVQIPFHLRYQPPQINKAYEIVPFSSSVLVSVQKPPCFKPMIPKAIKSAMLNTPYSCFYYQKLNGVDFKVPVGDASLSEIITNATFLVAIIGVLAVIIALVSSPPSPHKFKKE